MLDFLIAADAIRRKTSASFGAEPAKEPVRKDVQRPRRANRHGSTARLWGRTGSPSPTQARGY